jgi:hypothetical protein
MGLNGTHLGLIQTQIFMIFIIAQKLLTFVFILLVKIVQALKTIVTVYELQQRRVTIEEYIEPVQGLFCQSITLSCIDTPLLLGGTV